MALNLAAILAEPDSVNLSVGKDIACRALTGGGAEILEGLAQTPPKMPTATELIAVVADHLPGLSRDQVKRMGVAEMVAVLRHAAGQDLKGLIAQLEAETAASRPPTVPGKAAPRPTTPRRPARSGR